MGDVLKILKHSGDGSPLVHLRSRSCRLRQKHLRGLEHKHTDLGGLHLQVRVRVSGESDLSFPSMRSGDRDLDPTLCAGPPHAPFVRRSIEGSFSASRNTPILRTEPMDLPDVTVAFRSGKRADVICIAVCESMLPGDDDLSV
jgi:hypothetical protein